MWNPGDVVDNGRYTITELLGGGGFGITYAAIENANQKRVAIKILNQQSHQLSGLRKKLNSEQIKADFEQLQVKFRQEALNLARCCQHPHIVKVYDVIFHKNLWGMVMEYIDGNDLSHHLDKRGRFPEAEALKYVDEISQALEHVHRQNLLHLDVKPHNIILRDLTGTSILIDFGLAREYNLEQTLFLSTQGTPFYAPVEQYEKQGRFGPYTDIYSLSATLYHLLTGNPPSLSFTHKTHPPKPPKDINSQISNEVNRGILAGMQTEIQKRPQTITEFRQILGLIKNPVSQSLIVQEIIGNPPELDEMDTFDRDLEAIKFDDLDDDPFAGLADLLGEEISEEILVVNETPASQPLNISKNIISGDFYSKGQITLVSPNPSQAYAHWEVPVRLKRQLREQGGQKMVVRLYDVTDDEITFQELECSDSDWDLEIDIAQAERYYLTEIGYVTVDRRWLLLARSTPLWIGATKNNLHHIPKSPKILAAQLDNFRLDRLDEDPFAGLTDLLGDWSLD